MATGTPITITTAGINLLRDAQKAGTTAAITYFAVGTSSTAPSVNDTKLGAEVARKGISSAVNGTVSGEIIITCTMTDSDITTGTAMAEIGFFGGTTATSSKDTGTLVAHGLYSHTKVANETLTFTLDTTITQG